MAKKIGTRTILLENKPHIISYASVVGKKEHEGPLSEEFDYFTTDSHFGEDSFEKAESKLQKTAINLALKKANLKPTDIDKIFAGDLLNQCIGSSFGIRELGIPFIGLYGACSTMALSTALASIFVDSGAAERAIAVTSSHFCSAERQYRFPLGYGGQRTPTAQWTVTGAGAALVTRTGNGPTITACTIGSVIDLGIKDAANMGAAMAPAAFSTIKAHFEDMNVSADDFDLIVTGDLGQLGKEILLDLSIREGIPLGGKLTDCGTLVFDILSQDVHSGGSGCGCSAITLCGYLLKQIQERKLNKILFCGTGALLSPTTTQQGLPIPAICHAVSISGGDN